MGNSEPETLSKSEKPTSPSHEQSSIPAIPNWAAMQAFYPGMALPPPYFNSAVASGHPPHPFMWGTPQHMMPPYGAPYAAIYATGGVYAHPSVQPGSHSGPTVPTSPVVGEAVVATPLTMATPAKSSSNKDQGLMKKLKGFDGLVVSPSNGDARSAEGSHSGDYRTDGSSDGSDGNTGKEKTPRKRSCDDMVSTGEDDKVNTHASSKPSGEAITAPSPEGPVRDGLSTELWIKSERELKRERRKQSNRESARRSRLRKQAETEELSVKVESLNVENLSLRSEISRLMEKSEKLRLENAALMEKLKNGQLGRSGETISDEMEMEETQPISTENFLCRVNNSGSVTGTTQQEGDIQENSNSGTKLHQLLESSPRTDTVAAR